VAQGIGAALFEEMIYDGQGQLLTASLASYLLPTAAEIPSIDVCHLETKTPKNLGGFRGMGEGGTIGAPGAIANAVSDALSPLGVEVSELPITSDRIFKMLENAENRLALEKENGSRP
jgi:carbon-monoxide dehydrogenase large subunit